MKRNYAEGSNFIYPNANLIAGVDEVGRGPLCGDVVTAAVILDPNHPIHGLTDSKQLTEKKRRYFFDKIRSRALCFAIGRATVVEIDCLNILQATLLAMQRAVNSLSVTPDFVLIDGNQIPALSVSAQAILKGDTFIPEISAASILAKVTRDQEMKLLDQLYPQYGFAQHKGYATKAHLNAIKQYGITEHYRRSFAPVKAILNKKEHKEPI